MKIMYKPTKIIYELPEEECRRIMQESGFDFEMVDGKIELPEEPKGSTIANQVLGKKSPYDAFKQPEFDAELAKRGIDFKALKAKSNKDKLALLIADDAEKEKQAEFETLKQEAETLECEIDENDTAETLAEKIADKKAGV